MRRCLAFAALALAACQQQGPTHEIPLHDTHVVADEPSRAPSIVSLAHGGQKGPIPVNTELELAVTATDPAGKGLAYTWTATGGTVEAQGERAVWRTPPEAGVYALTVKVSDTSGASVETRVNVAVSSSISGDVQAFQGSGAPTTVESGRDQVGAYCSIDVDGNRRPHITYYNATHEQIRYAHWNGSQWVLRIVDGPGFNTGRAAGPVSYVKVGSDGHPRVAYTSGTNNIHFAQWNGTTWLRPATTVAQGTLTALALNPVQDQEPALVYWQSNSTTTTLHFSQRAGGTWGTETLVNDLTSSSCFHIRSVTSGTLAFSPDGTAHTAAWTDCLSERNTTYGWTYTYRGGLVYFERNPTTKAWANQYIVGVSTRVDYGSYASTSPAAPRLIRTGSGAVAIATTGSTLDTASNTFKPYNGLFYRAPGGTTWQHSFVDSTFSRYDVGFTPDNKPLLTTSHDGLELISTDAQGFWTYTYVGAVDSGSYPLSLAVDSAGQPHICYSYGGSLRYF